ncbi:thiol peroxidase [Elusimicrobium posterum]|uniref:thiol peroxidase n=1 Tax=Elusimicrobium posterum TaxID=3116653 RepID=UPI003C79638C
MKEIKDKQNTLHLLGNMPSVGDKAPEFTLVNIKMEPVTLSSYKGKVVILSIVPSIDTPTCSLETRRFNSEAANLNDDTVIVTVSKDLPFAQARWCAAMGVEKLITLSDYRNPAFGTDYGVLIDELYLLARAIFVIDKQGIIRYVQVVEELSDEPNYEAVMEAAKKLV